MRQRRWILTLVFSGLFILSHGLAAQERVSCEEQLARTTEELQILQDQHALITIPRAEADQRMLISLRRQLEQAQAQMRKLEQEALAAKPTQPVENQP